MCVCVCVCVCVAKQLWLFFMFVTIVIACVSKAVSDIERRVVIIVTGTDGCESF